MADDDSLAAALHRSETLRAGMLDAALDVVITIDAASRVVEWNLAAERTFGFSRTEALGRAMTELIVPPRLREAHDAGMRRYLETGEGPLLGRRVEVPAARRDGTEFPCELAISPLSVPGAGPLFTAYLRDLSERKRVEEEIRALNATLEQRVEDRTRESETLAELSATLERARTPEEVARAATARLAGPTRTDAFLLWRLGPDRAALLEVYGVDDDTLAGLRGRLVERSRGHMWTAAGEPRAVYVDDAQTDPAVLTEYRRAGFRTTAFVPVSDGEKPVVLTCLRRTPDPWSAGDRRLLEAGARSIGLALERAEFTRLLEAQNAELETFVYTASHDLRTPLLSIRGMGTLLEGAVRSGNAGEAAYLLGRVQANARRMEALLDDLLALARAGRAGAAGETLDLGETVAAALAELEPAVVRREAVVRLPDGWPLVRYPRSELGQVLSNLLGNALKWAGRGAGAARAPVVRVSWDATGSLVALRVEDNGPGIAPEHRERVFGLFQKLDASAEGTGVGLAIVKRIVERHGGRAWVEGSDLGGAAVLVTLPAG